MIPIYPLYALLFADTGLSGSEISSLFALWSAVGFVAEVPAGAVADRFSRRAVLVAAGILQASGYVLWVVLPGFPAFAAGFALWGLSGALVSGALEALLYDGLAAVGAEAHFGSVLGRVTAAGLIAQLPATAAASLLFSVGGYALAGWVSVGFCLAAAALATRLPEPPRDTAGADDEEDGETYLTVLRAGFAEATARPAVRGAVLAVALLTGADALDEYFPLLARNWGVATAVVPLAVLGIPLAGAACAAIGGAAARLRPRRLVFLLAASALALGSAGLLRQPAGLAAVAVFYGLYRLVLVAVEAHLQDQIAGPARATVTSVAAIGTEIMTFGLYAAWVIGGVVLIAVLVAVIALSLPRLFVTHQQPEPAHLGETATKGAECPDNLLPNVAVLGVSR